MTHLATLNGSPRAGPQPSGALRAWGKGATVTAVILVIVLGGGMSAYAAESPAGTSGWDLKESWSFLGVLAAIAAGIAMVWRTRYPWLIMWCVGSAALIFPIDPLGTLPAMGWVIPASGTRRALIATVWGAVVTVVALGRNMFREPPYVLLAARDQNTGEETQLPVLGYVVVAIMAWGIVLAVRRLANRGLGELRSLIGSLRDSSVDGYVGAPRSAEALARIVDEARAAGVRVQDHIDTRGGENLVSMASATIYRIVQESMTNAMRHAPASPVTVMVMGSPHEGITVVHEGITVVIASWLDEGVAVSAGTGSGIRGMQDWARAFGGDRGRDLGRCRWTARQDLRTRGDH